MSRNRVSSKRSKVPVGVGVGSTNVAQLDGSCFGKPAGAKYHEESVEKGPPPLPSFLILSDIEVRDKYAELTRLENERIGLGKTDPQWARRDPDPILDRYNNIFPWDNNRIKLAVPEGVNDYINASPVSLISTSEKQSKLKSGVQDKYICMQGPKKQTVDHVWHMIWHELAEPYTSSPAIVIMLTPTHAPIGDDPTRMFEKCYQYYPVDEKSPPLLINQSNQLGEDFKAQVRFEERLPGIEGTPIEIRKLIMTVEGEEDDEKPIYHYLYPNWPDFGALAAENVASILSLMEESRKQNGRGENPRLIHCSAGVGRTGTFVALEFLLGELEGGAWEGWDNSEHSITDPVYETVNQLRMQRKTMVQAYEQYAFLYEVCRKRWEEKYNTPCIGGEHTHTQPMNDVCVNGLDEDDN
ncbi:related to protein tyrosine phosphatase phi [Rhynchosporium secalis]|uniref:Related to protein tyrosine phosphatase phi n=1 Tax=Rhynchosporium secalis TaxID=38038 RepID=A0A1E1M0P4_RHYSE|nr:related to protein tyrosine phosphatase phi [Rhynchosporium secalis]